MNLRQRLFFGLMRILSRLPLGVLYVLSDLMYPVVYHVVRYRRGVVSRQLAECFPEKSSCERKRIERRFYRQMCDYIVETIREISMTPEEMRRRVTFEGIGEMQDDMIRRGKQFVFAYLGHYGNWEWLASFSLWMKDGVHASQIYHPLKNKASDKFFLEMRSRFGGSNFPMKSTLRHIVEMRRQGTHAVVGFIADQGPKWEAMHHWTHFLNHDTSFFIGTEEIGKQVDAMLLYVHVTRPRRGYYRCSLKIISWEPRTMPDYEITDRYAQLLEEQIRETPELWLWTHKRWKRTREEWERRKATGN